ncbi:flavodoxin [Lachnospiraceae bacterium 62-26]
MYSVKASIFNGFQRKATFYFPIWCGGAPNVVLTLLDALNLTGKHLVVFTTSGATKPIKLAVSLKKAYPDAKWHKPLNTNGITEEGIRNWM